MTNISYQRRLGVLKLCIYLGVQLTCVALVTDMCKNNSSVHITFKKVSVIVSYYQRDTRTVGIINTVIIYLLIVHC